MAIKSNEHGETMNSSIVNKQHVFLLEKKSKENYESALQAESNSNLNVAISRYYYSCLILTKRCLIQLNWKNEKEMRNYRGDSHSHIIDSYLNERDKDMSILPSVKSNLKHIKALRKYRRKADYYATVDYACKSQSSEFLNCKNMANAYIECIEKLHNIKIK